AGRNRLHRRIVAVDLLVGADVVGKRTGEIDASVVPIFRRLGQRLVEDRSKTGQFGSPGADLRWLRGQMLADDDRGVGVVERRRSGQQLESRCGKRVLVCATVDNLTFE